MTGGAASASSFVTVQPPSGKSGGSIIHLGLPATPAASSTAASPLSSSAMAAAIARSTQAAFQTARHEAGRKDKGSEVASSGQLVPLAFELPDGSGPAIRQVSPSIIAFEENFPAVAFEKVAAIPQKKSGLLQRRTETVAMLIRGGIVDSGRPGAAAPAAPAAPVTVQAPSPVSAQPASNRGGSDRRPPPEEPVKKAPPPPPPNLPRLSGPE